MLAVAGLGAGVAFAATGDQDPDFNGGVTRLIDFPGSSYDDATQVGVAPDGTVYVAGCGCEQGPTGIALAHLSAAGDPITGFGSDGALTDGGVFGLASRPQALGFAADGDVLVGVSAAGVQVARAKAFGTGDDSAAGDFTVVRYDADGTRVGQSRVDLSGDPVDSVISAIVGGPDGATVLGSTGDDESSHFARVTLDADGAVVAQAEDADADGVAFAAGHQDGGPAGSVVIAGLARDHSHFVLRRYLADGTVDGTYGGTFPAPSGVYRLSGTLAPDGSVYGLDPANGIIVHFTAAGQPDTSYGGDGTVDGNFLGDPHANAERVTGAAGGKLVVVATTLDSRAVIARLNADGTLDTTFGDGGRTTLPLTDGATSMWAGAVALQADSKPVVAGDAVRQYSETVGRSAAQRALEPGEQQAFVTRLQIAPPVTTTGTTGTTPATTTDTTPTTTTTTDTTTTTQTTATTTTTAAAAPAAAQPVAAQSTNPLPVAKSCVSRRSFKIRLRIPRGDTATKATVKVNGKQVKVVKGSRLRAAIDLRGLPKGKATVSIVVTLAGGKAPLKGSRTYHTCVPKTSGGVPRL
ncbi:hypothetical protein DSM104299_00869 [Baekduia alba]|nr:hypothetical protein DSM104299_00869 [Baekduia alba]